MIGDGPVLGDNTDVRPPSADELWHGGFFYVGGLDVNTDEPLKVTLDGVFFVDGGFAGPNLLGSWEQTVFAAEAHLACAALARVNSQSASAFFLQVRQLTGATDERSFPAPPPPSAAPDPEAIRKRELQIVGCNVLGFRQRVGDEAVIAGVAGWADAPVPKFHKLRP